MKLAQLSDPYLLEIYQAIEAGEKRCTSADKEFIIPILADGTKGALRVYSDREKDAIEAWSNVVTAIPRCLQDSILRFYHAGIGHAGINRMEESLRLK